MTKPDTEAGVVGAAGGGALLLVKAASEDEMGPGEESADWKSELLSPPPFRASATVSGGGFGADFPTLQLSLTTAPFLLLTAMLLLALDAPATVGSFTLLAILLLFTTVWSGSFTWAFATVDSTAAPPVINKVSPLIQTLILYALDMLSNFHCPTQKNYVNCLKR